MITSPRYGTSALWFNVYGTDRLTRELARDLFRSVQGTPVDFLTFAEFCEVGAIHM